MIYSRAASDGEEGIKIGKMIPSPCTLTIQSEYESPKITSAEMLHFINSEISLDISALIVYFQSTGLNKFSASFRDEQSKEMFQEYIRNKIQKYVDIKEIRYNTFKDFPDIYSGVVTVVANSIKEDIPRKIYIKGQQISTRYESQPQGKKCFNCNAYGHISTDCPEPPRKAWSSARTHPTRTRTASNESLSTQDSQESQDSQENTILSSGEIEVETYQENDTLEVTQTSTIDSTSIDEELDESKSSNESNDHEVIITKSFEVKFDKPHYQDANLICLQETGILNRSTQIDIEATTNFKIYSSDGENRARGVCILISKDAKEIIKKQVPVSLEGNLLHLEFNIESKKYQILNIYSPANYTRPQTEFYKQLDKYTELINIKTDVAIFGGDFNLITSEKDSKSGKIKTGRETLDIFNSIISKLNKKIHSDTEIKIQEFTHG
ncbi:unnamed protein product [Mytilus coruscus]|uniref:CCHC-type domain-containing protein n=1 Tax=Mytilus coruscus TaxID=42192 RepID=A0A6J8B8S3_MYTCO|nr:unnamed protein product [Mytilus coruscus]